MTERKKQVLLVGGVAGGASAAARLRRLCETAEIVVFDGGPYVPFANCGLPDGMRADLRWTRHRREDY